MRPPGPRGLPVFGNLFQIGSDPIGLLLRCSREYGEVTEFTVGPWRLWLLNHPDPIRHVLQDRYPDYPKSLNYRELAHALGNGLLTSEGPLWLRQRKLIQPAFHARNDAAYLEAMLGAIDSLLADWERGPSEIDVAQEMMRLALAVVGRALFSSDLSAEARELGPVMKTLLLWVEKRTASVIRPPFSWPTPANVRARRAARVLDDLVQGVIRARRERGDLGSDLLGSLLRARDDESRGMSDEQVRDEVLTLLLAGHETTANALAWTWYLLAKHPVAAKRLHDEVDSIEGPITLEVLERLEQPRLVVQEALRLYPPAWWIERQAAVEDELMGFRVRPGTFMIVSPFTIQRNPRFWDAPDEFRPERFAGPDTRPRGVYIPFGMGPRACVGGNFALLEARAAVVAIARRFSLSLVSSDVQPESLITLRPRGGIRMKLERRQRHRTVARDARSLL